MAGLLEVILVVILIVFPVLWLKSNWFRYNAKFMYFNFVVVVLSGFPVMLYSIFRPKDVRNIRLFAWMWKRLFKVFGLKLEVRKEHSLVSNKPYVLVSNHQSSLDMIGMAEILPDRCTLLAKKELMYAGPFGLAGWLSGVVFVDRLNKEKALSTMTKTAQHLKDQNLKLWVFPEGTRNRDGHMLPFKKGAFHLAIQAQVPVVPVVFSTYRSWLSKSKHIFNRGRIIIECLPPVPTEGMTGDDVDKLIANVRGAMVDKYKEINKELGPLIDDILEQESSTEHHQGTAHNNAMNSDKDLVPPRGAEMDCTATSSTQ